MKIRGVSSRNPSRVWGDVRRMFMKSSCALTLLLNYSNSVNTAPKQVRFQDNTDTQPQILKSVKAELHLTGVNT